jgi:hypothetical protein
MRQRALDAFPELAAHRAEIRARRGGNPIDVVAALHAVREARLQQVAEVMGIPWEPEERQGIRDMSIKNETEYTTETGTQITGANEAETRVDGLSHESWPRVPEGGPMTVVIDNRVYVLQPGDEFPRIPDEVRRRALEALPRLDALRERILAERGGRLVDIEAAMDEAHAAHERGE